LSATNRCNHQLDWPGLQQVCQLERTIQRGDKRSQEVAFAITSLNPLCATPQRLLRLWRGHWAIENRSHYVRDVVFGEDACRVRSGNAPQTLAALRNAVIGLLRAQKADNLAAAIRNLAWDFRKAAQLVGVYEIP
jgi:hypothetical protein